MKILQTLKTPKLLSSVRGFLMESDFPLYLSVFTHVILITWLLLYI